ncbi:nuclear transport factor 2 family protein [Streptomyces sp. HNM0574]|uniref:nuclear transport factor 2 family protein n=1 Tax=Streptomyces sp. HNM0574 TaxID=2714954 RepID=UPI00146EF5E4|nr:nuclear transport factor 2 family protein [Streptomyces sp. HNM0574]
MSGARTDAEAVEAANTALYDALEHGDLDTMERLWLGPDDGSAADDADVSAVHPGWPVLTGRGEVMRSYALIMAGTDYIQFFLTDVEVSVLGDTALVTCTENILSGGPAEADGSAGPLVGGLVVATNVFRRVPDGAWKLWSHHGSPVLVEQDDEGDGDGPDEEDGGQNDTVF